MPTNEQCFLLSDTTKWQSTDQLTNLSSSSLQDWLINNDSLTMKLRNISTDFRVKLLNEYYLSQSQIAHPLNIQTHYFAREVILYVNQLPWIYAKSFIPQRLIIDPHYQFANLHERSLGELLFNSDQFLKGKIEITQLSLNYANTQLNKHISLNTTRLLWGRRRYFHTDLDTIIVNEVFLPNAEKHILAGY